MKKRLIKIVFAFVLGTCVFFTLLPAAETEAASGISRISFVSALVDSIINADIEDLHIERGIYTARVNRELIKKSTVKSYKKNYGLSKQKAVDCAIAVKLGIIKASELKDLKKKITVADALRMVIRADDYIYETNADVDEKILEYIISDRIADIGKVKSVLARFDVAKAYMSGYIKGKAEEYSHLRILGLQKKIGKNEALLLAARLTDKTKRIGLSPDYQILREDSKAHNAELYPYILDSFPDAYYDTGFNGMTSADFYKEGEGLGADTLSVRMKRTSFSFVFPKEIAEFNALKYPQDEFPYKSKIFLECYRNDSIPQLLADSSVEFYTYALNIDFRTIDKDKAWRRVMKKYLTDEEIDDYIRHCKENKTIIECDRVASDKSAVYWYNGDYNCKVYAHVRIVSDSPLEKGYTKGTDQDTYGYLYPVRRGYEVGTLFTRSFLGSLYMGYRIGEWTDIFLNTNGTYGDYGCLNCSNTSRGIMIDYSGLCPWLYKLPF